MTDFGTLSSTSKLPVVALHYGGAKSRVSRIIYRLDDLICSGKSNYYPSETASADRQNLWKNITTSKIESQLEIENVKNQLVSERSSFQEKIEQLENKQRTEIEAAKSELIDLIEKSQNSSTVAFRATGVTTVGNPSNIVFKDAFITPIFSCLGRYRL